MVWVHCLGRQGRTAMVPVEFVPLWVFIGGIGHAVEYRAAADCEPAWTRTICDQIGNFHAFGEVVPSRVCQECRRRLWTAELNEYGVTCGP